jgi:hypothetical protein
MQEADKNSHFIPLFYLVAKWRDVCATGRP